MRRDGRPTAAYTWHVAARCVLVVVDLDREGWRSVTNDAAGFVADLAELRPDLLARVPLIAYQDSIGQWDALSVVLHEHLQRAHVRTTPAPRRARTAAIALPTAAVAAAYGHQAWTRWARAPLPSGTASAKRAPGP